MDTAFDRCFIVQNFEMVYAYVLSHADAGRSAVAIDGYEIFIADAQRLAFRKDGYSLGMIHRDNGITGLAKRQQDYDRQVRVMEELFWLLVKTIRGDAEN
jgi:hypothetical protein